MKGTIFLAVDELVAFANAKGGSVYMGIEDDGIVTGCNRYDAHKIMNEFRVERNGLLDKQAVWFKTDNKARLNTFKEQIEAMFGLIPIDFNVWENARDTFIEQINHIIGA